LAICLAGLAYKIWSWLSVSVEDERYAPGRRGLRVSLTEMACVIFGRRSWTLLLKALMLDGLLQRCSLAHSHAAWVAHILIFTGFTGLVLLYAMSDLVTAKLFRGYTASPWIPG